VHRRLRLRVLADEQAALRRVATLVAQQTPQEGVFASIAVRAAAAEGALILEVRDDGVGGADPEGQDLVGIADRVVAHRASRSADGGSRL
jgi:hypothetical protein